LGQTVEFEREAIHSAANTIPIISPRIFNLQNTRTFACGIISEFSGIIFK